MTHFIAVDLAWKPDSNPTGAAVLVGDAAGAELVDVTAALLSFDAVLAYIGRHATAETVVAIDAPLIIPNQTGQRGCDHALSVAFGARHASCHSANRTLMPNAAGVRLAMELAARGYQHLSLGGQTMMEVYPHAALVSLFDLSQIIRYKKGPVASRRRGLAELQRHLESLATCEPGLRADATTGSPVRTDANTLRGKRMKSLEDSLDAIVCAYVALHHWYWDGARTEVFGQRELGYIAVPKLQRRPDNGYR